MEEHVPLPASDRLRTPWDYTIWALGVAAFIANEARHDGLTGLLNKESWKYEVEERAQGNVPFGVVIMDMDGFKTINDTLGHPTGDKVLQEFGEHLSSKFKRKDDVLTHERLIQPEDENELEGSPGRYGGDEFGAVVGFGLAKRGTPAQQMEKTLAYFREVVDEFIALQAPEIQALGFNIAIGGAIWDPSTPTSGANVIEAADHAMLQTKFNNPARTRI